MSTTRIERSWLMVMMAISSKTNFANSLATSAVAVNAKRSLSHVDNERCKIARPGFEPGLSDSESKSSESQPLTQSLDEATTESRCTTGCTNSPENEHGEAIGGSVSSRAESLPIKVDSFSAALALIASLPLSDAEKAECVRRLMAEQAAKQLPKLTGDVLTTSGEQCDRSENGGRA